MPPNTYTIINDILNETIVHFITLMRETIAIALDLAIRGPRALCAEAATCSAL